ncbi:MAG: hypothetical protein PHP59_08875 [Methanofollis sp.]|uniref:hypothetical protein n=1 Tax=Methanofollis sp. TaxID=2052835 RepID=UPI00262C3905|nr:hypothetical protein [Methanofollis sp.]MDD4255472.1 hypothetical protein [Methanofollis sp.]
MAGGDLLILLAYYAGIGVILLSVFLLPLRIGAAGGYEGGAGTASLSLRWAAFGVSVKKEKDWHADLLVGSTKLFSLTIPEAEPEEGGEEREEEEKEGLSSIPLTLETFRTLFPHVTHLLGRVVAHITLERLVLWIRADFGGPIATGKAFGAVQAVRGILGPTPVDVDMEPLFSGGDPAGRGEVRLKVDRPIALLGAAADFALAPPVRRIFLERGEEK